MQMYGSQVHSCTVLHRCKVVVVTYTMIIIYRFAAFEPPAVLVRFNYCAGPIELLYWTKLIKIADL